MTNKNITKIFVTNIILIIIIVKILNHALNIEEYKIERIASIYLLLSSLFFLISINKKSKE
ncbi:MAG: hypothetical protein N2Z60_07880 [Elusimicrobiales bacterium]|nr:hypothetical protein [Elusimicrobiales bacterium]HOJ86931.1 hypothetical protein [Elusimicrobiales bacterium]HOL63246.1 hypothetical protein [Elusimicrobiales bacterium]HPO96079.1 hypothetical protein [Elusimicrobiales bacterium]